MNTFRDLINQSYLETGVIGTGMDMTGRDLTDGLACLNAILDELYTNDVGYVSQLITGTASGTQVVTIGLPDDDTTAEQPDVEVPNIPLEIEAIYFTQGSSRTNKAVPVSLAQLSDVRETNDSYSLPCIFNYQQPIYGESKFATITFDGVPTGNLELLVRTSVTDLSAFTDISYIPREVRPFVLQSLAARICTMNNIPSAIYDMRAKAAKASLDVANQGWSYDNDTSIAAGMTTGGRPGGGNGLNNFKIIDRGW